MNTKGKKTVTVKTTTLGRCSDYHTKETTTSVSWMCDEGAGEDKSKTRLMGEGGGMREEEANLP